MKKTLVLILVASLIGLFGMQQATADSRSGFAGNGCGCGRGQVRLSSMDAETRVKYDRFLKETTELRRQIAEKRFQQRSLMFSRDADVNAVAKLTEEIAYLQKQLQDKAREQGLDIQTTGFACAGPGGQGAGPMGRGRGPFSAPPQVN